MDSRILNFLSRHRILVLSTLLKDGTPYSAACHYSFDNEGHIVILTEKTSKKCEALDVVDPSPAAITIGFSEEEWVEFQATGGLTMVVYQGPLFDKYKLEYEKKFKTTLSLDQFDVFLIFDFAKWKYTEFKSDPKVLIENE